GRGGARRQPARFRHVEAAGHGVALPRCARARRPLAASSGCALHRAKWARSGQAGPRCGIANDRRFALSKPAKYTDEVDPAWSTAAVDNFRVVPHPDSADPVALELDGTCPRCQDHMQHTEFLIAFRGVSPTSPDALRATLKTLRATGIVKEQLLPA